MGETRLFFVSALALGRSTGSLGVFDDVGDRSVVLAAPEPDRDEHNPDAHQHRPERMHPRRSPHQASELARRMHARPRDPQAEKGERNPDECERDHGRCEG